MLVPTSMISGPLAEWLGFSTFFFVVMFASVPSAWAAFKAPFPIKVEETHKIQVEGASGQDVVTVDDPSRLSPEQREVQGLAGRASLFATLAVLAVLVIDAWCVGKLRVADEGHGGSTFMYFGFLVANFCLKAYLIQRTFGIAKQAADVAKRIGDTIYVANGKGAKVAAVLAGAIGTIIFAVGAKLAF
jgi:MFS transporter, PAT family, beta-lactamase induction signal transducer AmpG